MSPDRLVRHGVAVAIAQLSPQLLRESTRRVHHSIERFDGLLLLIQLHEQADARGLDRAHVVQVEGAGLYSIDEAELHPVAPLRVAVEDIHVAELQAEIDQRLEQFLAIERTLT